MGQRDPSTGLYNTSGADWDAGLVMMAAGVASTSTPRIRMMYFGGQITHSLAAYNVESIRLRNITRGWGLVELRQEGFGYVAPNNWWTDAPVTLTSRQPCAAMGAGVLYLNADVAVGGGMTVALLDASTQRPLAGGLGWLLTWCLHCRPEEGWNGGMTS